MWDDLDVFIKYFNALGIKVLLSDGITSLILVSSRYLRYPTPSPIPG